MLPVAGSRASGAYRVEVIATHLRVASAAAAHRCPGRRGRGTGGGTIQARGGVSGSPTCPG